MQPLATIAVTRLHVHSVTEKGDTKLVAVTLLILNRISIFFILYSKFAAKYLLKIPQHLTCIATLPCETLMSENELQSQTNALCNDKLQVQGVVGL